MLYTDNYNLKKPQYGETADVADINYNADKIDGIMWDNRRISVAMYDTSETYDTPETAKTSGNPFLAGHEDASGHIHVYKCLTDNTTGTWDGTKWEQTDLASEIEEVWANAGTEVEANPSGTATDTLEKLRVDSTIYAIPENVVSKEAEGNPIEITDGASAPLVKCETAITGSQDLHGYDKPWVGGAGKNKLPLNLTYIKSKNTVGTWSSNAYTLNGVTFTVLEDESNNIVGVKVNGQASADAIFTLYSDLRGVLAEGTSITVNGAPTGGTSSSYRMYAYIVGYDYGSGVTGTIPNSQCACGISVANGYNAQNLMFYPMVRLSSVSDPAFQPYSNICPISGYDEVEIGGCGKNLFDIDATHISYADVTYQYDVSGLKPNTSYTLSTNDDIGSASLANLYINGTSSATNGVFKSRPATVNSGVQGTVTIYVRYSGGNLDLYTAVKNGTYYIQLEEGTTPTEYTPYTPNSYTISLGSTRYGGTLDVVRGVLRVTHGYVDLGSLEWTYYAYAGKQGGYTAGLNTLIKKPTSGTSLIDAISSGLAQVADDNFNSSNYGSFTVNTYGNMKVLMEGVSSDATLKTALDGIYLCYELSTPLTISLTPTQVRSLLGNNYLSCSTGDMEIEYITGKYQPLVNLMKNMVVANPSEDATATLEKLKVNDTVYSLPSGGGGNTVLANSLNTLTVMEV